MLSKRKRILIYSHDTYGLGHLRRSLVIASQLCQLREAPAVLIVSGSPKAHSFRMPEGCDCLKLPCVTKSSDGSYRSRTLAVPLDVVIQIRREMIRTAVSSFAPHVVLVDHAPVGVEGELLPLFEDIRALDHRPTMVLGLRDIIDDAAAVSREWMRLGVEPVLKNIYDRILVYGDPRIRTTAQELGLDQRLGAKLSFTGYLARQPAAPLDDSGEPTVLVTAGGGGDGLKMLRAYARVLEALPGPLGFRSLIVSGPFLSQTRFSQMQARFGELQQPVELVRFTNRMEQHLAAARGIISMGGYNSVAEILASGKPALIVPRESPRLEQLIRAERLAECSNLEVARMGDQLEERMAAFVGGLTSLPVQRRPDLNLDGLREVAGELGGMLRAGPAREVGPRGASRYVRSV